LISKGLDGKFDHMSQEQRALVIKHGISDLVMPMYSMGMMWKAQNDCAEKKATTLEIQHTWDQAAAYLIGSLEGPLLSGAPSADMGQFDFNLNRKLCKEFNTCVEGSNYHSKLNDRLVQALERGKEQIASGYCKNLQNNIISFIEPILVAGQFQGLLSSAYAIDNDPERNSDSLYTNPQAAYNYVHALAVIPLVEEFFPPGVDVLNKNSIFVSDAVKPMQDGYKAISEVVTKTFENTKTHTIRLNCADVGVLQGPDGPVGGVCPDSKSSSTGSGSHSLGSSRSTCTAAVSVFSIFLGIFAYISLAL